MLDRIALQCWIWAMSVDPRGSEVTSATAALAWLVVALLGPGMTGAPHYEAALALLPAQGWWAMVALASILQGACLLFGRRHHRRWAAMYGAALWGAFSGLAIVSGNTLPSAGVYLVLAVINAWAGARLQDSEHLRGHERAES